MRTDLVNMYARMRESGLKPVQALTAAYLQLATDLSRRCPHESIVYVFNRPVVGVSILKAARDAYAKRGN